MVERYPVIHGAEEFYLKAGKIGILLSHGFIGTPQSVRYVGERLHQKGYTVLAPRLIGHGTHYEDLERCKFMDWYETFENSYKALKQNCSKIIIMGQSMGGTLAIWLASMEEKIDGLILINPALTIPSLEYLALVEHIRWIDEERPDIKAEGENDLIV